MPPTGKKTPRSVAAVGPATAVGDYEDLLALLAEAAVPSVVIGGCAVGVYARRVGETVLSEDLDLYATARATRALVGRAVQAGAQVLLRPQPRRTQVTVLDWRGLEVNVLHASRGLRDPETEGQLAREIPLQQHPGLTALIADPFSLLANKLAIDRPKDRPHVGLLVRFLEEEIAHAFEHGASPRDRIGPAQRYLTITRQRDLDEPLFARLLPQADGPTELRFLANHAPSRNAAAALLSQAQVTGLRDELSEILGHRKWAR